MSDSEGDLGRQPVSLTRSISPPPRKKVSTVFQNATAATEVTSRPPTELANRIILPSPFQLTPIRDAPQESNVDAVSLRDLLGDPLVTECWDFNYLHDIDFLMSHFDRDTKFLVKVHVVHGFWKRDDTSRLLLVEQASEYSNVTLHTAHMPEMFGTHHTKMLILFRNDNTARVIIHTANMIAKDWTNMTNGVWKTPHLPLLNSSLPSTEMTIGSGGKFQHDLLNYLRAYNTKREVCKSLVDELAKYDFAAVRGVLIASVPGKHPMEERSNANDTRWGWAAMKHALRSVPTQQGKAEVVVQISSIATLGPTDKWLQQTLFDSLSSSSTITSKPNFKVVFPTPDEIRQSLDGYASGGSIHTKIQSAQQVKQLQYLRPMFCHWANDSPEGSRVGGNIRDAGRQRAAPHIKTYIRYGDKSIDWALLTSANVSKQAWGEAENAAREIRIASWEIGVLVWPELLAENAKMVGTFKKDMPSKDDIKGNDNEPLVGLRIPYNLPLQRYGKDEKPWVVTTNYTEPDHMGRSWESW